MGKAKLDMKEKIEKAIVEDKLEKLFDKVKCAACKFEEVNLDCLKTDDFPKVFDLMKDTAQTMKYLSEKCYYDSITEAMEEAEYGEDYGYEGKLGYRMMDSRGRYTSNRRGYVPDIHMMEGMRDSDIDMGRMYYSTGIGNISSGDSMRGASRNMRGSSSRYGYSHDKYMNEKKNYSISDPEDLQKRRELLSERLDDLYKMAKEEVMDMTPDEKSMWKSKINMIMNV